MSRLHPKWVIPAGCGLLVLADHRSFSESCLSAICRHTSLARPCAAGRRLDPSVPTSRDDVVRSMALERDVWGPRSLHPAAATVYKWSRPARLSASSPAATGRRHADPRSTGTPLAGADRAAARCCCGRGSLGGLHRRNPIPGLPAGHDHAGPFASADEHSRRPRGRAWHLRGELPYGQGDDGLGQAKLPGDRLGRSPGGALGHAAGNRQGRHSGGRRHRRGHQGSAAGHLGAIGGRLHAVRSQAAPRLAGTLVGPSLVRGIRRNKGQPRIITDTDSGAHQLSRQLDGRSSCRVHDEVTGSSPVTPTTPHLTSAGPADRLGW
jgi:hypothetical protein